MANASGYAAPSPNGVDEWGNALIAYLVRDRDIDRKAPERYEKDPNPEKAPITLHHGALSGRLFSILRRRQCWNLVNCLGRGDLYNPTPEDELGAARAVNDWLAETPTYPPYASCEEIEELRALRQALVIALHRRLPGLESLVERKCSYSDDFTSVVWYGTSHQFAKGLQAECVRVLWEAWVSGAPRLSEQTIREKTDSNSEQFRLYHVFHPKDPKTGKRKANRAWGTMIRRMGKGIFALSAP